MSVRPFRIARSKSGLGMFATARIPKNTRIFEYTGNLIPNEEVERWKGKPRYLYDLNKRFTLDGSPRSNIGRYANHSCRPNAKDYIHHGRVYVKSLRVIEPGEEITYDYGKAYFDEFIGKDNCRCPTCTERRARPRQAAASVRVEKKRRRKS